MPHWLLHFFGLDSASGTAYLAWSGILSDLSELALLGAFWSIIRKHNCHEPHCLRIGTLPVTGTPWHACRKHHPSPPERGHMTVAWHAAQRGRRTPKPNASSERMARPEERP